MIGKLVSQNQNILGYIKAQSLYIISLVTDLVEDSNSK